MSEPVSVYCRDVRNRPQRITVSMVDGQVLMSVLPTGTTRLTPVEAGWLAEALQGHVAVNPDE